MSFLIPSRSNYEKGKIRISINFSVASLGTEYRELIKISFLCVYLPKFLFEIPYDFLMFSGGRGRVKEQMG